MLNELTPVNPAVRESQHIINHERESQNVDKKVNYGDLCRHLVVGSTIAPLAAQQGSQSMQNDNKMSDGMMKDNKMAANKMSDKKHGKHKRHAKHKTNDKMKSNKNE